MNDPLFLHTLRALDVIFGEDLDTRESLTQIGATPSRHTGLKSALDARHTQRETLGRDVTGAANSLAAPLTITLSNGELVEIDAMQIAPGCWSVKAADRDYPGGWGETRELATQDLRELLEDR